MTRCGLNIAFCFVFIIHTEIFPTFFLATSYGLCNFVGRSLTLAAPIIAESPDKLIPVSYLMASCFIGMVVCMLLKKPEDGGKTGEEEDEAGDFD